MMEAVVLLLLEVRFVMRARALIEVSQVSRKNLLMLNYIFHFRHSCAQGVVNENPCHS